jgi:hypothetical protein
MAALNDPGLADGSDPRSRLIVDLLTKTVYRRDTVEASLETAGLSPGDYPAETARGTWTAAVPDAAWKEKLSALIDAVVAEQSAFGPELERQLRSLPVPAAATDLRGLTGGQIRLLRETARVTVDLSGALAALARASPMSRESARAHARLQRSLSQAEIQLQKGRVSVGGWPDEPWAMDFIDARTEALRQVRAAEKRRCRTTAFVRSLADEQYIELDQAITRLQRLLEKNYQSLFTPRP